MSVRSIICLILIASACATWAGAGEVGLVPSPTAYCPKAARAPKIDGLLDDDCWNRGHAIELGWLLRSDKPPTAKTLVYLAYDAAGLYIGFRCEEPEPARLKTSEESYIWRNDSIEITLDSDRDRRGYEQFILDAAGRRFQQIDGAPGASPDRSWAAPWRSAVARGEREWTAEVFVPASTMGLKMRPWLALGANFARNEQALLERISWTPRGMAAGNAMYFGDVLLQDGPGPVEAELAPAGAIRPGATDFRLLLRKRGGGAAAVTPRVVVEPPPISPSPQPSLRLRSGRAPARGEGAGRRPGWISRTIKGGWISRTIKIAIPDEPFAGIDVFGRAAGERFERLLASYRLVMPPQRPPSIGQVLLEDDWGLIWEACATSKVVPEAEPPSARRKRPLVEVFAARNEFEPFQIVVRPKRELANLRASVGKLSGPGPMPPDAVSVRLVGTVNVTQPTSADCAPGEYPDPLIPFESAPAPAGRNTALWFTVHVPADAKPGDYRGTVTIRSDGIAPAKIPLWLHVWGFALPKVPFLRTAYGCDLNKLCMWHGVTSLEDKRKLAEIVNRDFIEHRIAPLRPMIYWDPDDEMTDGKMSVDFTEFDRGASMFLPEMNSFNLPGAFMSGVGRHGRGDPGYEDVKLQFLKILAAHLKAKGWFEKGYDYIYDEPREEDYPKVIQEAKLWRKADPGFKILLTEQPEKPLFGAVDIWTPVLDAYNSLTCRPRQAAGESIWWYVCCGPHHPYPNNFIDYRALDHRVLQWMNWKYGVTGVLYWQTMFWQADPWGQPMSRSEDGKTLLGNGDGMLLYPALRNHSRTPLLTPPVDSIRWEMIREGVEDYDYFRMLSDAVKKAEARGGRADLVKAGKAALAQVDALVRSVVDYEKDPMRYYAARAKVAEALEKLVRLPTPAGPNPRSRRKEHEWKLASSGRK